MICKNYESFWGGGGGIATVVSSDLNYRNLKW